MVARNADIFVLGWLAVFINGSLCSQITYHIEGDDIFEGNLTSTETLDKNLVDDFGTATGGKTQHERLILGWLEGLYATWINGGITVRYS